MWQISHEKIREKEKLLRQRLLPQAAECLEKEAYHRSVNRFSKEGYKLMRNPSLWSIPEEWETELQLLVEEAKENSARQVIMYSWKAEGESFRNTDVLEENLHDDSLLQRVNTLHPTENAILDNQVKEQIWRGINWSNLDTREFQFSLKFNITDKLLNYTISGEGYMNIKYMHSYRYRQHQGNTSQTQSPGAKQSRSRILRLTTELSNVRRSSHRPFSWMGRLRNTVPDLGEYETYTRVTQQNR